MADENRNRSMWAVGGGLLSGLGIGLLVAAVIPAIKGRGTPR